MNGAAVPSAAAPDPIDSCVYAVEWRRKELPAEAPPRGAGVWLVLGDARGTGAALADKLRARGNRCVLALAAEGARAAREGDVWRFDPARSEDYQALVREASRGPEPWVGVAHLLGLDAATRESTTAQTLASEQRLGGASVVQLLRAVLGQPLRDMPRLALITRGVQAAGPGGFAAGSIAQAPLWGLGRTIALEHPELECRCIDLEASAGTGEIDALARELGVDDEEGAVALRGGGRFVARLARSRWEAAPAKEISLRAEGSYLITGGLGGLGLELARWMVDEGARHIALAARRGPSEEAVSALARLREAGAKVLVVQADVSRAEDVARLVRAIEDAGWPPLRGVVHAAGVATEPQPLVELSQERLQQELAPKMLGAWNLHTATQGLPLDFFLLYSSASAILGLVGQGAYAASNAFLDALSRARNALGQPATSIQWGAFAEAGMVARAAGSKNASLHAGMGSITPAEGARAIARLLSRPRAEVAVARLSVRRWFDIFPQMASSPFWSELRAQGDGPAEAQPVRPRLRDALEGARPELRASLLEEHVREQIGQVLGLAPRAIDRDAPFRSIGVDSLMSLDVRNRLDAGLGLRLPATLLFVHPNLAALVEHLLGALGFSAPEAAVEDTRGAAEPAGDQAADRPPEEIEALLEAKLASLERLLE